MSQEELKLNQRLEVNELEMVTQQGALERILDSLYKQGAYKEYIDIKLVIEAMIHITERKKDILYELEQVRKNEKT